MLTIRIHAKHPTTGDPLQLVVNNPGVAQALTEEHFPSEDKVSLTLAVATQKRLCAYTTHALPRQIEGVALEILSDAPRGRAVIDIFPLER
jgi:hypothetical protein